LLRSGNEFENCRSHWCRSATPGGQAFDCHFAPAAKHRISSTHSVEDGTLSRGCRHALPRVNSRCRDSV
jgi:hypothetical protein